MRWWKSGKREQRSFRKRAYAIELAHGAQTRESVALLARKYAQPVFGRVDTWTLIERLSECVDPTDVALGATSQKVHVLQVLEAMERDGVEDGNLWLAALLHDLGKLLLLAGEKPENVVCFNTPIGSYAPGIGLDACVMQWNHDEFGFSRLEGHVPEPVAWLVRYHSLRLEHCEALMNERDCAYTERYLRPFQHYDQGSKSQVRRPSRPLAAYRDRLGDALPRSLVF
jgi:hypothetical protein